jgi:hypothetical protein
MYTEPFWPFRSQKESAQTKQALATTAFFWRCSEPSRSRETPETATARSAPTGRAHTTASLSKRSPVAVMTTQPLASTRASVTGVA